jgi:S-disulfanyl-L-cysteine oxidoreductase SoxD
MIGLRRIGACERTCVEVGVALEGPNRFDAFVGATKALPPGRGTAKEGAGVFAKRCAVCHGQDGQGGVVRRLVIGSPGKPHQGPFSDTEKDGPSYYPYPTIAWDYINRAMPASKPGSLTPDEVYAVVAFLYYRNGIIGETDVLDAKTLPKVEMPNRNGFVPAVPVYPPEKKPSWATAPAPPRGLPGSPPARVD